MVNIVARSCRLVVFHHDQSREDSLMILSRQTATREIHLCEGLPFSADDKDYEKSSERCRYFATWMREGEVFRNSN